MYGVVEFAADLLAAAGRVLPYVGAAVLAGFVIFVVTFGIYQGLRAFVRMGDPSNSDMLAFYSRQDEIGDSSMDVDGRLDGYRAYIDSGMTPAEAYRAERADRSG